MGGVWFDRKRILRYFHIEFSKWERYCYENNIRIVDEVKNEIKKFMTALTKESSITTKTANFRLVFDKPDFDIRAYAIWLVGEYVDY